MDFETHRARGTRREDFERPWSGALHGAYVGYGGALLGGLALLLAGAPFRSTAVLAAWAVAGFVGGAVGGAAFGWRLWRSGRPARWRDILLVLPVFGLAFGYLAWAAASAGGVELSCHRQGGVSCHFEERRWLGRALVREGGREGLTAVKPFQPVGFDRPGGLVFSGRPDDGDWIVDDFGPEPLPAVQGFLASDAPSLTLRQDDWGAARNVGMAGLAALVLAVMLVPSAGAAETEA